MMRLKGYAIVTGGSRGLGKAMCLQLASEGYNVVVNYVSDGSKAKTDELVKKMETEYGVKGLGVQADVSDYAQCQKLVQEAVAAFGENIAVLVNNAGIAVGKSFLEVTPDEYQRLININLTSVLHCTHVVVPYMVKQNYGAIVSTSSVGGLMGVANQVDYSAAKAGVIGFTKAMAKEFGPHNITVNAIAPGMIWTDMLKGSSQEAVEGLKQVTPLGIIGEPQDIADCLSYIINAKFLTGQTISPNGGLTI